MWQTSIVTDLTPETTGTRVNRELIELWRAARGVDGACPSYAHFNTNTLARYADTLIVLHPLADGDFHYGHFGSPFESDVRRDLTGTRHSDLRHAVADELARHFRTVIETGAPMLVMHGNLRSRTVHTWEHMLLPVESPQGRLLVTSMVPVIYKADLIGSIVQSSPGAILACSIRDDHDAGVLSLAVVVANTAADCLFDQSEGGLLGRNVPDLIPEDARRAFETACSAVAEAGKPVSLSLDIGSHPQDLTISRFDGGLVLTFVEFGALRRAHADLDRRALELATLKAELSAKELALVALAEEIDLARASYDREVGERRRLEAELRRLAETDDLTGHLNRRAFFRELQAEISRAMRYGHPASLLYIDIDRFKQINDTRGHAAGDAIIRTGLTRIGASLRGIDVIGRLGGDEFAILLPETGLTGALVAAERIRTLMSETHFMFLDQLIPVTVSVGIATWCEAVNAGNPETVEDWVARADNALYEAKNRGRNTICAASTPAQERAPLAG